MPPVSICQSDAALRRTTNGGGMRHPTRSWRAALVGSIAVGTVFSLAGLGLAGTSSGTRGGPHGAGSRQHALNAYLHAHSSSAPTANHTPDDADLADQFAQSNPDRTPPAPSFSAP